MMAVCLMNYLVQHFVTLQYKCKTCLSLITITLSAYIIVKLLLTELLLVLT